jgi:RNA polymerase sigma-70 factor (sigma-E family)
MSRQDDDYRDFVRSRAAPLHRTAYLLCGDWHLADDLVQEALAKAYRHWRKVQRADSPDAYVKRILVNETNRHWRHHRNTAPPTDLPPRATAVPDPADGVVDRDVLLHALLSLPARQRATIVLRYLDDMSERDTAAVLHCGEGTVKSQTSRALGTLKSLLSQEELSL